jgi:alcohol dehydrogenase class IV
MPERLGCCNAVVFNDVSTNPTEKSVLAGLHVYQENNCDAVVALGGGSPIDCAKSIALKVTHSEPLENYALLRGGLAKITAEKPDLIAVPTTSGTGSEVGRGALVTMASGQKLAVISKYMIPTVAVCDPELTLELPPKLTAATGMDAISHCIETFCSPKFNPVADAIALDGLERAVKNLQSAVENGADLNARTELMMASLQGGLTFQKGLGLIHSLSHPLGSLEEKRLHHGTLNAIFLPHVLRFNAGACPEKMDRMADAVGAMSGNRLPEFFEKLVREIGLPTRLSELDVSWEDVEPLADAAFADHSTPTNPRTLTVEDCLQVFRAAM